MGYGEEDGKETAPAPHPGLAVYPSNIQVRSKITASETWSIEHSVPK